MLHRLNQNESAIFIFFCLMLTRYHSLPRFHFTQIYECYNQQHIIFKKKKTQISFFLYNYVSVFVIQQLLFSNFFGAISIKKYLKHMKTI
jgi:hypothetical protein